MGVYAFTPDDLERVRRIVIALCERHERTDLIDDVRSAVTETVWFNTVGRPSATFIWRCAWHTLVDALRRERHRANREAPHSTIGRAVTFDPVDFERRLALNAAFKGLPRDLAEALLADHGERLALARRDGVAPSTVTRRAQRAVREIHRAVTQRSTEQRTYLKGAA